MKWNIVIKCTNVLKNLKAQNNSYIFLEIYIYTLSILLKVMDYSVMISLKNEYVQSHQNTYLNKNNFNTK